MHPYHNGLGLLFAVNRYRLKAIPACQSASGERIIISV